jgi:hypothetical protein
MFYLEAFPCFFGHILHQGFEFGQAKEIYVCILLVIVLLVPFGKVISIGGVIVRSIAFDDWVVDIS